MESPKHSLSTKVKEHKLKQAQKELLDDIASDFDFHSIDDLARYLGYQDSNQMAQVRFNKSSLYECMTSTNNTSFYLQIHGMLDEHHSRTA